ncbi:hypothetical protein OTU49_015579, partial [Cherax quadricarinatus]
SLLTTALVGLGRFILALCVFLLFILVFLGIRKYLQRRKKLVPLPTPPVYRRQLSAHTEYPPTPPISRQQLPVYAIFRPTPPASPLYSVKSEGKCKSPFNFFGLETSKMQPYLYDTPPGSPASQLRHAVLPPGSPAVQPRHVVLPPGSPAVQPRHVVLPPGSPAVQPRHVVLPPGSPAVQPRHAVLPPATRPLNFPHHLLLRHSNSHPAGLHLLPHRTICSQSVSPHHLPDRAKCSKSSHSNHLPDTTTCSKPNRPRHLPLRANSFRIDGAEPEGNSGSQAGGRQHQLVRNTWSLPGGLHRYLES